MKRYARSVSACTGSLVLLSLVSAHAVAATMYRDGRELLAILRANGERESIVLFAAAPGQSPALVRAVQRAGGAVQFHDGGIDYVRARVPVAAIDALVSSATVSAATIDIDFAGQLPVSMKKPPTFDQSGMDQLWRYVKQTESTRHERRAKYPPQAPSDYPVSEPYPVIRDLGGEAFRREHPTYDGRGVGIALLDGAPDFLLPELQEARTLDGKVVPKVISVRNTVDPVVDGGAQWVDMRKEVSSSAGTINYSGKSYRVPAAGRYRIGLFNERLLTREYDPIMSITAEVNGDVDRDGNPPGSEGLFAVLWDESRARVWVDTNRDQDFTDERALGDSGTTPDHGVFGHDDPATAVRESVGFTVQIDRARRFVALNLGAGSHGAMVLGAMIASRGTSGRFDGIAPGAQLVSLNPWPVGAHGALEALLAAVHDPKVDLAVFECDNATNNYLLRDGNSLASVIIGRLLHRYGKPILIPGDNQAAFSHNVEYGLGPDTLSIGGYQSRDSYAFYAGITPLYADNLHAGGLSHGPAGEGRLKPDVLSPSGQLDLRPGFQVESMGASLRAGLFSLPPGYSVSGGTSQATPTATGAVAVLISAAKQAGIPHDFKRINYAVRTGARFIDHHQAHEQGNGVIDIGNSWRILQQLRDVQLVEIDSHVRVNTALSRFLAQPHQGTGIFEREGWSAGMTGERVVTFTRRSGARAPMRFAVSWKGNDGTFSADSEISLPLNQPVELKVGIAPSGAGVHSALLVLTNPQSPVEQHRMMATVVAASQFTAANGYTIHEELNVKRPGEGSIFVNVPSGTAALRITADSPERLNLRAHGPDSDDDAYFVTRPAKPGAKTLVVERPRPGVWSIELENSDDIIQYATNVAFDPLTPIPIPLTPARITASIYKAEFGAGPGLQGGDGSGEGSLEVRNMFAPIEARVASGALGSGFSEMGVVRSQEQRLHEIRVPEGADDLLVRMRADADAAVDLYLFDCTGKSCELRLKDLGNRDEKTLSVRNPSAGRWLAVVDGFGAAPNGTRYDYLDVFTGSRYGALSTDDSRVRREPGAHWVAKVHTWAAEAPSAPRQPYAVLTLQTSGLGNEGPYFVGLQPVPLGRADAR